MNIIQSKNSLIILILVILFASFVRFYKLGEIPVSISWDEAAVGYNAWAVANYGMDEWGNRFPLVFKSFMDDKHPIHIYLTAIPVKILGLSEFSTRFSAALFGVFNVIIIFFLARKLFKSDFAGVIASFVLAISPYNVHFSRFSHEFNFAIFFFLLGFYLFLKSVEENYKLLPFSFFSFGISFITYHSPKVIIPLFFLLLIFLYRENLKKMGRQIKLSMVVVGFFTAIILLNPGLLGLARVKQTSISDEQIKVTSVFLATGNKALGKGQIIFEQYLKHFSFSYLFLKGDQNPRLAPHNIGQFFLIDFLFIIVGLIFLTKSRSKVGFILLFWLLISPIPSSSVNEAPQSARAMFMAPVLSLIISFGILRVLTLSKNHKFNVLLGVILVFVYGALFNNYFKFYTDGSYNIANAIEFQYGMKEIVQYIDKHPEYAQVYMTDVRSQPYIFFLYYLKVPPQEFLKTAKLNEKESKTHNLISEYDRFKFGGWDVIESEPYPYYVYIIEDSKFGGLVHQKDFGIDKLILFPSGSRAFYIISKS